MGNATPGPWTLEGPDEFGDFNVMPDGQNPAIAAVVSNCRPLVEIAANARLIAAAPETAAERDALLVVNAEMLEALKALLNADLGSRDKAKAAISKAEAIQ